MIALHIGYWGHLDAGQDKTSHGFITALNSPIVMVNIMALHWYLGHLDAGQGQQRQLQLADV